MAIGVLAPHQARAAAEQNRFAIVISGIPSSIDGGDFNNTIDFINQTALGPAGLEPLERITFGWQFDLEARYFLRPNIALNAGVGQLRSITHREYLPALSQAVDLRGEVLTVPIHIGGAYYFVPYTQGDFQARAFVGASYLSLVYNKALFDQSTSGFAPGDPSAPPTFRLKGTQDSPGYRLEFGVHMFFASRYSVLISGLYRSAVIRGVDDVLTGQPFQTTGGEPFSLDMSGLGARFGLAIGL